MGNIISKIKQRVSTAMVIEDDMGKIFVKKYDNDYSNELISSEYEKSLMIYEFLKNNKNVSTPKPLKLDLNTKSITFEFIENAIDIKDFIFKNNKNFFNDKKKIISILDNIIGAVASIHLKFNNVKGEKYDVDELKDTYQSMLLGDLCSSNVLIRGEKVFLIDFSPSYYMFPVESCKFMSSVYLDIIHLVYIFKHPPLYYRLFINHRNNKYFEMHIIRKYFKAINHNFNKEAYNYAKKYYLDRYLTSLSKSKTYFLWKLIIDKDLKNKLD